MPKKSKTPITDENPEQPALIGYARVSTKDQNLALQINALEAAGCLNIWSEKVTASGKARPELDHAIMDLRPGDTLVVWRLDRLARNMRDLYRRLDDIAAAGAKFRSLQEGFDFDTISGQLILGILGLVAQFERQLIAQRTSAGIKAAQERGDKWGRETKMTAATLDKAEALLRKNWSADEVATKLKVAKSSIYTYFWLKPGKPVRRKKLKRKPKSS
jgi:DNA invertase Pin-like site-specific DNA recombinase